MSEEGRAWLKSLPMQEMTAKPTALGDYVWPPIVFEDDVPRIYWRVTLTNKCLHEP